jgi:hypothetical protein
MNTNEKATLGGNRGVAHENPDPNANLDRNRSPHKSTREAHLLAELRAATLALSPGMVAFVGPSGSAGWFRIERLDALTARVTHVSEGFVAETLLEEADFMAAQPLGGVA